MVSIDEAMHHLNLVFYYITQLLSSTCLCKIYLHFLMKQNIHMYLLQFFFTNRMKFCGMLNKIRN